MDRGRGGGGDRGFRPFRGRGSFWGGERGRFVSRGRRSFGGFYTRSRGSSRGGQFFQSKRPFSKDLRSQIQERNRELEGPRNFDEGRYSQDSSDVESVSSEYDASSARYRQPVESEKGGQHSNSPMHDRVDKGLTIKFKEKALVKRRVFTDPQYGLSRQDGRSHDMAALNESMKHQSLNDQGELPLVPRIGRLGHIQRGLPRLQGPRGVDKGPIFHQSRNFSPRGRGYRGAHRRDNSRDRRDDSRDRRDDSRDREKPSVKEPKAKKQQASWIPLDEEETEKSAGVLSVVVAPEKKIAALCQKIVQSKVVAAGLQKNTVGAKVKSTVERKLNKKKEVMDAQEDTSSVKCPPNKDISVKDGMDSSDESSEAGEGNKNNSSLGQATSKKNVQQGNESDQKRRIEKESVEVPGRSGYISNSEEREIDVCGSKRDHLSRRDAVSHFRKSGSLERDESSWISLERTKKRSLSEESEFYHRKDDYKHGLGSASPDMEDFRTEQVQISDRIARRFPSDGDRPATRFPLSDRSDLCESLIASVRSTSKEGDDLYKSEDESSKVDLYRRDLEVLESSRFRERGDKDIRGHEKTAETFRSREHGHIFRKDRERVYESSQKQDISSRSEKRRGSSSPDRGKLKEGGYGMSDSSLTKSYKYRSLSRETYPVVRTENDPDRSNSRESYMTGGRQSSLDRLDSQERYKKDITESDHDRADLSKRYSINKSDNEYDRSNSWNRGSKSEKESDHSRSISFERSRMENVQVKSHSRDGSMVDRHERGTDGSDSSDRYSISERDVDCDKLKYGKWCTINERESDEEKSQTPVKYYKDIGKHSKDDFNSLSEKYSLIDSDSDHDSLDSEKDGAVTQQEKDLGTLHSRGRYTKDRKTTDSSTSSSENESDNERDEDRLTQHNIKRRHAHKGAKPRGTIGRRERERSDSTNSGSRSERKSDDDSSDSLRSCQKKKFDKFRKPQYRERKHRESDHDSTTDSSKSEESTKYYRRHKDRNHDQSDSSRRYSSERSRSSHDPSESSYSDSDSYTSDSRERYRSDLRERHTRSREERYHDRSSRRSDKYSSDSSESYTWTPRGKDHDRSSSKERYTREGRSDGKHSDVHRSSSREGSHSSPFKNPSRVKCKEVIEKSNLSESPLRKGASTNQVLPIQHFSLPKPRVGYGRHIFPSLPHSTKSMKSRSRSRSVSVAKFKIRSNLWLREQEDLIKQAELKLIQESIDKPLPEGTCQEKENTADLVKATESLQITVEQDKRIGMDFETDTSQPTSSSQDAVILQEHIKLSKSSDSDVSPRKTSLSEFTITVENVAKDRKRSSSDSRRDIVSNMKGKTHYKRKDVVKQSSKVLENWDDKEKGRISQNPNSEAEEWNSRKVFMKETVDSHNIPEQSMMHEEGKQKNVSSVVRIAHDKGKAEPVGQLKSLTVIRNTKVSPSVHDTSDISMSEVGKQKASSVVKVADVKGISVDQLKSSNVINDRSTAVPDAVEVQFVAKRMITPPKPGIKVILAQTATPATSSPKKSFWNSQKRRVSKGFQFSPVKKTTHVSGMVKSASKGGTPQGKASVAVLTSTHQKLNRTVSKEETSQKMNKKYKLQTSVIHQPARTTLEEESSKKEHKGYFSDLIKTSDQQKPKTSKTTSKTITPKHEIFKKCPSQPKIIDIFEDDESRGEAENGKEKVSPKSYPSKEYEASDSKVMMKKLDFSNIPLPNLPTSSPEKSSTSTDISTMQAKLDSPHEYKNVTKDSKTKDKFIPEISIKSNTADALCSSDLKELEKKDIDKVSSEKSDCSFIRVQDTAGASQSDHEEVDMDLDHEEPDISLEEDTSWMGPGQSNSSIASTPSFYVPSPSCQVSTPFTSLCQYAAWGPGFGSPQAYQYSYIPLGYPPPNGGGYWHSTQNMTQHYVSQQYSTFPPYETSPFGMHNTCGTFQDNTVNKLHTQELPASVSQDVADASQQNATVVSDTSPQKSSTTENQSSINSFQLKPVTSLLQSPQQLPVSTQQGQFVSTLLQESYSDISQESQLSAPVQRTAEGTSSVQNASDLLTVQVLGTTSSQVQQPEDQVSLPVPSPVQPPQDLIASSVTACNQPPLPEDPYPFSPPVSKPQPPYEQNPLLESAPVKSSKDLIASFYSPVSQPEESVPLTSAVNTHVDLSVPSLVSSASTVVPSPVPPPKDQVPCLVSPPMRSFTLPFLSPGESVLTLMPAPVSKPVEVFVPVQAPGTSVPLLAPALVKSPKVSVTVMSPLLAQDSGILPMPALISSKNSPPTPVLPPQQSPTAVVPGSSSLFQQDVFSSLIPPLQHLPVSADQDVSLQHIAVPLPVPPPQEWSSVTTSEPLPENTVLSPVPLPVPSPQQLKTLLSPPKRSSKVKPTNSSDVSDQKSKPSPIPSPQMSPNIDSRDHLKKVPLLVPSSPHAKSVTRNSDTKRESLLTSVPTLSHSDSTKVQPAYETCHSRKTVPCSLSDDASITSDRRLSDSSQSDVPQSPSIQLRDPRLQKRSLEETNSPQGSEALNTELAKVTYPQSLSNQHRSKISIEKLAQSKPHSYSLQPKRKTGHLDAQSKCLKQLKSILKNSLAKSTAHIHVPRKVSKPKTQSISTDSHSQSTRSPKTLSQFDAQVPKVNPSAIVTTSQGMHQQILEKPQSDPDCDYSDVPMDIDDAENSDPVLVSNQPLLPEPRFPSVDSPFSHGAPVPIPTSLPLATASNIPNYSAPSNKPSRDPRLQGQSKKHEAETRLALKTLFKVLHRPTPAKTIAVPGERLKPVAKTTQTLQTHDRSSQGAPTGPGSTSQTFGIERSPNSKKQGKVVESKQLTEYEASVSRLKSHGLCHPVCDDYVSDDVCDNEDYNGAGRNAREEIYNESTVVTSAVPATSFTPSRTAPPEPLPVVTVQGNNSGGSSDYNVPENVSPLVQTSGDDDQATPAFSTSSENQLLGAAQMTSHEEDGDRARSDDEPGQWLAEPPVPRETQPVHTVKPSKISSWSASDQGICSILASDVERSPVYPSTSFDQSDVKRGIGVNGRPLSCCSDSRGPLSTEKVRGMSHKDVSDWVKQSTAQCLFEPEPAPSPGRSPSQGKKKQGDRDKKRHHSGSSASVRSHSSGLRLGDGKPVGKSQKGGRPEIKKFLSHDASPKSKDDFSRSKFVDGSRWAPEMSNPLGSYRIPKLSSATADTAGEDKEEEKRKKDEEGSKQSRSKSQDDSSADNCSESDDDLLNETPAFLKEFEETSKAILAARMTPGTPDNTLTESMHSDDSLVLDEPTVSYKPALKSTDAKSTFSLDALLAEKVENEETNRELNSIQKELKEGIKQGGFVRLAEEEVEDSDDELLPEHHQKLQYFQVSENTIQDQHPGEVVLQPGKFPCLYSEVLSPVQCGMVSSESFLEKHLANIHPDALTDLLTTDMLSICFHKITAQEEVLRWIFFIMSVHHDSCVIQGCKKLVFDIIHTQLSVDKTSNTWAPPVLDVLKVLVNFGGDSGNLLQAQTLYSQEDVREAIIPEIDDNLTRGGDNNNIPTRSYAENVREFLQTVAFALQGRPQYSTAELNVLLVMMAKASLEQEFTNNVLLYEFSVLISSILPCYKDQDWDSMLPSLCYQLSEITSHHHNFVYLAQLFPHGKRGSSIQRRLAYLLLMKMLQPETRVSRDQLIGYKLHQLSTFFPAMRELASDDLYALSSAVGLLDIAVGNEPLKGTEKNDLQRLMELLRTLTSDVRDNVRRLDHTRVKDLMVRISSKWTVTLQTTTSKQKNLFAWTKQKSPQKMQVQRLETGASDLESDDEEDEEEEEGEEGQPDGPPELVPTPMETDAGAGGDTNSRINSVDDLEIESEETSSSQEEEDRTANQNNNADVASVVKEAKEVCSGNSVAINSEVRVVLEDICMKANSESDNTSSDDESLPELDITL